MWYNISNKVNILYILAIACGIIYEFGNNIINGGDIMYCLKVEKMKNGNASDSLVLKSIVDVTYMSYDNIKDFYRLPYIEGTKLNFKVKEDFDNHRLVDLKNRKTAIDKLANILAFIYDLNLNESKLLISEKLINDIINTFIKTYNVKDTSECLYLKDNILKYLNNA